jgi:hypothetical protein
MNTRRQSTPSYGSHLSREAKNFFSLGGSLSVPTCAVAVHLAWKALESIALFFSHPAIGLLLSLAIVYSIVYWPPEPEDYPAAGQRVITPPEAIFGLISALTIHALALTVHK